jgi:hypothetical protein
MTRDEQEEERAFLAELKARTGKDLAQWMAAIGAKGFSDKNETIDWLRLEGFPFARASWLERIHSNGGKPIYQDGPVGKATPDAEPAPQPHVEPAPPKAPPHASRPAPHQAPHPATPPGAHGTAMDRLIAAAKGYRPLYLLLEAEIRKTIADVRLLPKAGYISIAAPREFAAITLHATQVRLGLDLGDRPFDALVEKSRLKGPPAAITHMVILTDARQVNAAAMALLAAANARVNG